MILFTSGSTGIPKGVMHSLQNVFRSAKLFVNESCIKENDKYVCFAELHTISGIRSLILPLLINIKVTFLKNNGINFFKKLKDLKPQFILCGPHLLELYIKLPLDKNYFSKDCKIFCGGANLNKNIALDFSDLYQIEVLNFYGLTETSGIILSSKEGDFNNDVLYPCHNVNINLIPFDSNNKIYYLEILSPNLFLGYLGEEVNKRKSFNTEDLVYSKEFSGVKILGRKNGATKSKNGE